MSPIAVERVASGGANSEFYSGAPALSAYHSAVLNLAPSDSLVASSPQVVILVHRRQLRRFHRESSVRGRNAWAHSKARYNAETHSGNLVFGSSDMTGPSGQQVLDLVGKLASHPQSYSVVSSQPPQDMEVVPHPKGVAENTSVGNAYSFRGSSGGRVAFSDIEPSSDEDLIEAGYPFYSNVEDPELAAESRRSFLKRIGLG